MWFSIGFGTNMYNTDMIVWHADGDESNVIDYYSTENWTPEADEQQDLDYYHIWYPADEDDPDSYPKVNFLIYRDLDTNDAEKDYILDFGQHDMVYAFNLI